MLFMAPAAVRAQTPAPAPSSVEAPAPPVKPDAIQRVAELIAKSSGPYKEIALGIWETTYQGKNLPVIRVRIAAAEEGVFFIVPLFARDKLALSQAFLLRIAEFNAEYDYVKLGARQDVSQPSPRLVRVALGCRRLQYPRGAGGPRCRPGLCLRQEHASADITITTSRRGEC